MLLNMKCMQLTRQMLSFMLTRSPDLESKIYIHAKG